MTGACSGCFVIYVQLAEDIKYDLLLAGETQETNGAVKLWQAGRVEHSSSPYMCVCQYLNSILLYCLVSCPLITFHSKVQNGCQRTSSWSELILIPVPFTCVTSFHFVLLKMYLMFRFSKWMSLCLGFSEIRRWFWSILNGKVLYILSL